MMTMQNNMQKFMQNMHMSFFSCIQNMQDNMQKMPAEYVTQNMQISMQNMHIPFFLMQNMQDNMQNMQINMGKICRICKKNMQTIYFCVYRILTCAYSAFYI